MSDAAQTGEDAQDPTDLDELEGIEQVDILANLLLTLIRQEVADALAASDPPALGDAPPGPPAAPGAENPILRKIGEEVTKYIIVEGVKKGIPALIRNAKAGERAVREAERQRRLERERRRRPTRDEQRADLGGRQRRTRYETPEGEPAASSWDLARAISTLILSRSGG